MTLTPSAKCVQAMFRGLPIAGLSAAGVIAIQQRNYWMIAATSFAINRLWASNVRALREGVPMNPFAFGAACGSVLAVWLFG